MLNSGSLQGLKIIDLSRVLGGPFCTQILGDHGADIIKLEPPQGDETRQWGPPFRGDMSAYFEGANRNKKSAVVDLRTPEGQKILFNLLENADILIHNFKSGTLEKWGIGFEEVLSIKYPKLILCHVSGFGDDGPLGGLPGYDAVIQAITGIMSVNGNPGAGPVRMAMPIVDLGTGLYATIAILMAVYERQRSGQGQKLDISLYDCALSLVHPQASNTLMSGKAPKITGNAHPNISPYDLYKTGDGPIFLAVGNNAQFSKLCIQLENPELAEDLRFLSNDDRVVNREALKIILEDLLENHNAEALSNKLLKSGVPAGPLKSVPSSLEAPHTKFRNMVIEKNGYKGIGTPIKMSRSKSSLRQAPPRLGEHTREICKNAGISFQEIEDLITRGIVKTHQS